MVQVVITKIAVRPDLIINQDHRDRGMAAASLKGPSANVHIYNMSLSPF
jgi:hypothetical protein